MLFIFGTKPVSTTIQQGVFSCPSCNTERNYLLKRYKSYFTLFFIPLIPLKYLGDLTECQACRKSYAPESVLSKYDNIPQNPALLVGNPALEGLFIAAPLKRFGAYFVDMIMLTIFTFPTIFLIKTLPLGFEEYLMPRFHLVIFFLWFLYFFAVEYFSRGYTIGKKMFSIQTMQKDGGYNLSIGQALIRSLIKIIPILPVVLLFTKNKRAIHDYAAGSVVVQKR